MTEPKIHFQWQNRELLRTIYPLRTLSLRNALEYYEEIDLWTRYRGKTIEDIPEEVEKYHRRKETVIRQAKEAYENLLDHFFDYRPEQDPHLSDPELSDKFPEVLVMLKKAKKPYADFQTYYAYRVKPDDKRRKVSDPARQAYFISQQLETLDKDRRELDQRIIRQSRRVDAIRQNDPNHKKLGHEEGKLTALRNAVPLFERQREKLAALVAAFSQIESRKRDYLKQLENALKTQRELNVKIQQENSKIKLRNDKIKKLQADMEPLRLQLEPASADNYIADPDALTEMAHRYPHADPDFCGQVDALREEIAALGSLEQVRTKLKEYISILQAKRAHYAERAGPHFREPTLKACDEALERMQEYSTLLDRKGGMLGGLERALAKLRQAVSEVQVELQKFLDAVTVYKRQIDELEILNATEEMYVYQYRRVPPTLKDIINLKLDEYREELLAGDKTRDPFTYQFFLLGKLIERFKREPERFPHWLQYMIVHFSGMRYASAHGSWADPNDLLRTLQIFLIKNKTLDDVAVEDICLQRNAAYAGNAGLKGGREGDASRRARKNQAKFWERLDERFARTQSEDPQERRQGLLSLLLDEETYGIETMSDDEALDALEELRDEERIPIWMWKEISALTDLRLKEAQGKDWEVLTEAERRERAGAVKYREILTQWKEKHLTGWREEHQVNIQNLVSRAVCNEVAEHILHLRGLEGAAGLTSLADLYIKAVKKPAGAPEQAGAKRDAAYFVRSKKAEDFRPGAGILWLKYRNDPPPQWNQVKPFKTTDGDKTLPDLYINGKRWNYKDKDGLFRTRTVTNEKGFSATIKQYLFWVHIATVAEVAETAEGEVALTFETSLPSEDRRKACVGVFKRAVHNLRHDGGEDTYNASFVGYLPDKPAGVPEQDLDAMLDWDKVLLKV